ncbi:hypothetical protein QE374_002092 [Microbacterium sp. SORGH_AS428]|uniref:hypothetical protein n=1 Tax=Microbacterium sp. SORGH_AS_0428 TaxID=3041788 RepID=UPI00285A21AB|nr:hypothetical protein [Microbacterium sp. SORGH_AS_0428]MDR6200183.1 hypothetical protein [Microbacterium sp. SORGH_AS_0428]
MRRTTTLLTITGSLLIAAGMLTGCAGESAPGESAVADLQLDAGWVDSGRMIAVVTEGSSTCVPVAETPAFADGVITVSLDDTAGDAARPCTKDLVPRVTLVGVPEGVDPAQATRVDVRYGNASGSVELPGVAGLAGPGTQTDFTPSAGWLTSGDIALVTWGSSSCAPVADAIEKTADAEITVTFQTPPADRACTMDMAPRALLGSAEGVAQGPGVELVLVGDTFDNTRVPVL